MSANLTVRNYGFFMDMTRYYTTANAIPLFAIRPRLARGGLSRPMSPWPVHRSVFPRIRQRIP